MGQRQYCGYTAVMSMSMSMSMLSWKWHFTNKSVTGAPYSIKGCSLPHSWTLWWRVRWLKHAVPSWGRGGTAAAMAQNEQTGTGISLTVTPWVCTGWVKKVSCWVLIVSEYVNKTEKTGGTWTNKNSYRENEAVSDIFTWNILRHNFFMFKYFITESNQWNYC